MVTEIIIYIGGDNKTKMVSDEYFKKIESILSRHWDGFTLTKHKGYYKGQVEESVSAVIMVLQLVFEQLDNCVKDLKVELVQETIGIKITSNVDFKLK